MRPKCVRRHDQRLQRLERGDGGDPGLAADERELAEHVAWIADAQNELASALVRARNLHATGEEDHHPVVGLLLEHHDAPPWKASP